MTAGEGEGPARDGVQGGTPDVTVRRTDCTGLPGTADPRTVGVTGDRSTRPTPGARSVVDSANPDVKFDTEIVEHVRLVVSLIERREVLREDVLAMLERAVRQHRIGRRSHLDYVLAQLEKRPP